jgi:hypothetical protein
MNISKTFAHIAAAVVLSSLGTAAMAQALVVKCETRSNRSKASVDGNNLASGNYSAVLISGSNTAQSPLAATKGDEVGFDFDSNAKDVRKGAVAIAPDFIVGKSVTGQLLDAAGNLVIQRTATCRAR